MAQLSPYLSFKGNCREAMEFYKECLGGDLTFNTIGESPIASQMPAESGPHILHSSLISDSISLFASDMVGPEGVTAGNTVSLFLNCKSEEEINRLYNNLSSGGKIRDPLSVKFWGDTFGVIEDKFGINWMFDYNKNAQ